VLDEELLELGELEEELELEELQFSI